MQNLLVLNLTVHILTTGISRVNL